MQHCDSRLHVSGKSYYVDDVPPPAGMLHGAIYSSPEAHGVLKKLHLEEARSQPGVLGIFTFRDIPGEPYIGPVLQDEPLFAHEKVMYQGHCLALIIAETPEAARKAVRYCRADIDSLPAITCPREAYDQGSFLEEPRIFEMGKVDEAWGQCAKVVSGSVDLGGQEHLYLETNRSRAIPREDGHMTLFASTQSPSAVQRNVARILGLSMNEVEIDVKRLGGGFGGKEDQATHWACMAALAANALQRPVEIVLNREEDLRMTGKRHPYKQDFKIGLSDSGKILAFEVSHFQNGGAFMDLSAPVLERTVLHATNAYAIPQVRIRTASCRTHLPPNTAFRGFGGPQGMFAVEAAIAKAAREIDIPAEEIQRRNLVGPDYTFHYGQKLETDHMQKTWDEAASRYNLAGRRKAIDDFNQNHALVKKGLAVMPVCFGISFTKTFLNQGSSLVHVYTDGTVNVTTGGVEMGQGVSSNMVSLVCHTFGIPQKKVHWNSTNTFRIANVSPSAASATTDLNGNATLIACREIRKSLLSFAAEKLNCKPESLHLREGFLFQDGEATDWSWEKLVQEGYLHRAQLMAHGFYTAPKNPFDGSTGKGRPFHYYTFGTCLVEATVDCLRGTYQLDSARIVHDLGRTIVPTVDLGQVEGGLAQGIGWVTLEELAFDENGRLTSNALSTYKAPNAFSMPTHLEVNFLEDSNNPIGPLGNKAVGEPPFMYGIAAYFAIQDAVYAYSKRNPQTMRSPLTPEQVFLQLHSEGKQERQLDQPAMASS